MTYAPHSLSYADGIEKGTRLERERITQLIQDAVYGTDKWDTATIFNITDLYNAIEKEEDNED